MLKAEANNYPDVQSTWHYYMPSPLSDMCVHNKLFYHHLKTKPKLNPVYLDLSDKAEPVIESYHYTAVVQLSYN